MTDQDQAKDSQQDASVARFESALEELESIVARMDQGEQTLEASLKDFERGVRLARECQTALRRAEHKVETLLGEQDAEEPRED